MNPVNRVYGLLNALDFAIRTGDKKAADVARSSLTKLVGAVKGFDTSVLDEDGKHFYSTTLERLASALEAPAKKSLK